jgi:CheY-like chemotaxis protein
MLRILIADDDPVCLLELEAVLSEWGYSPVIRQNGAEAW